MAEKFFQPALNVPLNQYRTLVIVPRCPVFSEELECHVGDESDSFLGAEFDQTLAVLTVVIKRALAQILPGFCQEEFLDGLLDCQPLFPRHRRDGLAFVGKPCS
jgi:hypothetical protein